MSARRSIPALALIGLTCATLTSGAVFGQSYDDRPYTDQPPPGYPAPHYDDRQSCDRGLFTKQNVGTVLGAAVGGLLGSQFGGGSGKTVATIAGVVGGGFLGNQVGAGMDQADQGCMAQTLDQAPPGRTVSWRNPDNGRDYRVTPRDEFYRHGERCRNVESVAIIEGQRTVVTNVACRRHDGTWAFDN